jgi:hypothetical protein
MNQGSLSKVGRFLVITGRSTRMAPITMKASPSVVKGSLYDDISVIEENLKSLYMLNDIIEIVITFPFFPSSETRGNMKRGS